MRRGAGHVIVGALLLTAGLGVSFFSKELVWYGAIVVGLLETGRGLNGLARKRPGARDESSGESCP